MNGLELASKESLKHTCQSPEYENLETSAKQGFSPPQNPREGRLRIPVEVNRNPRWPSSLGQIRCKQCAKTAPIFYYVLCNMMGLSSDQLRYLLNIYKFDCSRWFTFSDQIKAVNKSTKSTSRFIFSFEIAKITKLVKKNRKKATVGSSRETGRFDEKLGDSRENRECWQVC